MTQSITRLRFTCDEAENSIRGICQANRVQFERLEREMNDSHVLVPAGDPRAQEPNTFENPSVRLEHLCCGWIAGYVIGRDCD